MWQEIIVGLLVVMAFLYVIRQWWPKKSGSCGGCGGCNTSKTCTNPNEKGTH